MHLVLKNVSAHCKVLVVVISQDTFLFLSLQQICCLCQEEKYFDVILVDVVVVAVVVVFAVAVVAIVVVVVVVVVVDVVVVLIVTY